MQIGFTRIQVAIRPPRCRDSKRRVAEIQSAALPRFKSPRGRDSNRHVAEIQIATWPRFKSPRGRDSNRHLAEIARACGGRPAASHSRARRVRRRARPRGSLCPSAGRVTSETGWTPSTWRSDQCPGYEDETHAAMLCRHARCVRKEGHDQSDLFDSSTIGRRRRRHRPKRRGGSRSACVVTGAARRTSSPQSARLGAATRCD